MANYRLSASLVKKWKACPFSVYCKITEQKKDEEIEDSYGIAGNVVHKALEYYHEHLFDIDKELAIVELETFFNSMWNDLNIGNPAISRDEYWLCVVNGVNSNFKATDMEMCIELSDPVESISSHIS